MYFSWHPLSCKPGQNKTGYRGEIELKLGFTVHSSQPTVSRDKNLDESDHHKTVSKHVKSELIKDRHVSNGWSDDIGDNDDPGVVSEIEDDDLLEEFGTVSPVFTPTHSSEDILEMFDNTGMTF